MQKIFLLKGLDCPHCSAEIEREVGELKGVNSSIVNLMKQTLTVEVNENERDILKHIEAVVHNHEPEVEVLEYASQKNVVEDDDGKKLIIRLAIGTVLFLAGIILGSFLDLPLASELVMLILAYAILGGDVILKAVKNLIKGRLFDENFLMSLSTVGAFLIGEYHEAVAVMLFYQVGEYFQELSVKRSRKSISELMDIRPEYATVKRNGVSLNVSPEDVAAGEIIIVKPGEKIPLDGVVTEGFSTIDTKALTGESLPKDVTTGDEVLSGCVNQNGMITVRVTKEFSDSTASKIIDLVENASSRKAPTENFITKFARYYTPVVVILAALLAVIPPLFWGDWADWIRRGLVFLVISCPCALVISIPLAFFGGIGAASKHGVLIKGSNYLEALNSVSTVVFDKTGTLTKGVFNVSDIIAQNGYSKEQLSEFAAIAESYSNHPIAKSIVSAYGKTADKSSITDYREVSGCGVSAVINGKSILVGNAKLMVTENVEFTVCEKAGTKVYIAVDGEFAGCIIIADEIKKNSKQAICDLKKLGVKETVMLTGDDESIAEAVAKELLIDRCYANLLPSDKVEKLELTDSMKLRNSKLIFVGDGINDAPVLARADIGVAMGGLGSDAAIEAADIVIMTDEIPELTKAIRIAKYTKRIVIENIVISLTIKGIFLILGAFGFAGMWEAVFADVGVALIAVLNSMRVLKK